MGDIADSDVLDKVLLKLGHLNIENEIEDLTLVDSSGASCDVFTGYWQVGIRRAKVAVKKIRIHCNREPAVVKKLVKEAYIWSKLQDRNVLPLLGFFLDKSGYPHLVSMWMAKGTLLDYLNILKPGEDTIRMAKEIAAGISYLHNKGIIHADLKSQNIIISDFGRPLIMDFGVSLIMAASVTRMCGTTRRSSKGTVRWTAIELFTFTEESESTPATDKSDVWAFGMVLYELLTRKLPFYHLRNDEQVILAIVNGTLPNYPSFGIATTEQKLWDVCKECWTKLPSSRPTIDVVRDQIDALFPAVRDRMDISYKELNLNSLGLWGSQVAIVPSQGDWFATYDPFVAPERQLNINPVYDFVNIPHVRVICFSNNGKWFCALLWDGSALIFNTETLAITRRFILYPDYKPLQKFHICISPHGTHLSVKIGADKIQIWNIFSKQILHTLNRPPSDSSQGCQAEFFSHGLYVAVCFYPCELTIKEIRTGRVLNSMCLADPFSKSPASSAFAISTDDRFVAAGTSEGVICIWEISSGNLVDRFHAFQLPVDWVAFSPNGKGLVCWTRDRKEWAVWDITALDSPLLPSIDSLANRMGISLFQPLSKRISSSAAPLRSGYVRQLTFDGQWVIESVGNHFYFRDTETKETRLMLQGHNGDGNHFYPSPQGRFLATSDRFGGTLRIWRYSTVG